MKFKDYKYIRPDMEKIKKDFSSLIEKFNKSVEVEEQNSIIQEINSLRSEVETMSTLVSIRNSIDTTDKFYADEKSFFDEKVPEYQDVVINYYRALVNSKFRKELERKWGTHLFELAEIQLKTFSPEIIEDMVKENKLITEYEKLISSAKIVFEGEERNLSQLQPFMESKDREVRKRAYEAHSNFFKENEEKFDQIYDELVKLRDKMAKKLGYKNFVELGYARMSRTDYNAEMVANYREQVKKYLVPIVAELKERQRKRLGLPSLKYYDEPLEFVTGNATPKGDPDWILKNGKKMFGELSEETKEFFNFMIDRELMDLVSKKGKMSGGYCTYINKYKSPFIFSNFNGTSGDVDVLTHEGGHAFQCYESKDMDVPEYVFPTSEAAEIHSMSMEFLTWPWMNLFFEDEEDKYKFSHLSGAVNFIPYGVTVDEFQHFVYENPEATPRERKSKWREIEKKYLPFRDYEDNDFLNRGGFWFKQSHIFEVPFYYIDYTLAQVCAFQFWIKYREDRNKAWNDYLKLCKAGGSKSFLELVKIGNIRNPFEDGCIKEVVKPIKEWLDGIDDSKF
ncbi:MULTISPECIES: M3 family oligoendopeptidase [Tissierellales]|jgi:M3 family oligoendopeptidase|uniref:M3 family oligoendopeptidase n=1 Tax=Acidilutibacter cellobiosedens TaxID=2507161 RepID=A0A410Q9V8_9FIRM|nr:MULTISPECIES: M3 family oligoendopeptidase [Tissierellales]MBE6083133.1 M3 family oligoendopeptidase [Tissierellaceae bacterium]QAT60749.1 M3 family oligoendopeptidase [Acidilutibacter cellobiosedens]SCL87487.1 Oligoendopeptidase F, plasmid [Sporanaerobacter sp. PP17-6a]